MLWYSLEAPRRGASNEYPQHMFSSRNKKDISIFRMKKAPYLLPCFSVRICMPALVTQLDARPTGGCGFDPVGSATFFRGD